MHFAGRIFLNELSWHHLQKVRIAETCGEGNLSCFPRLMMNLLITCSNMEARGTVMEMSDSCVYFSFIAQQVCSFLPPLPFEKITWAFLFEILPIICCTWYLGFKNFIDRFIWFSAIAVIIAQILRKKDCIISQEGITVYRFKSILILDGCP